jgi:hypothetical protein
MPLFLIETPHTPEECMASAQVWLALDAPRKEELFELEVFGCEFGLHDAWLIAEFEDEREVERYLPKSEALRGKARVFPVSRMSFEEMMRAHETA